MSTAPAGPARRTGLVVEDQTKIRTWLCAVLAQTFEDMDVVSAHDLRTARAWLKDHGRHCEGFSLALVDIGLPDGSGIELIKELAVRHPGVMPVVTTVYDDDGHLFEALAAGAQGFILKDEETDVLARSLRGIERGEPPLSPAVAHRILNHFRQAAQPARDAISLTGRETEVLSLLGRGLTIAEAAKRLGLTENTVAGYVKTIYQKLNISSRAEAALEAHRRGLV
jgi:DNA-binding NarL/FixJ family response regulator